MKSSELMIGDLVNLSPSNTTARNCVKIHAIDYDNQVSKDYVYDIVFLSTGAIQYNYPMSTLKPIPLTEEILKKNGFKDISDHTLKGCDTFRLNVEQRGFDYRVTVKLKDYFKLQSYDDRWYTLCEMEFGCNYVHQLQHALKLCGIDKEIVL